MCVIIADIFVGLQKHNAELDYEITTEISQRLWFTVKIYSIIQTQNHLHMQSRKNPYDGRQYIPFSKQNILFPKWRIYYSYCIIPMCIPNVLEDCYTLSTGIQQNF